MESMLSWVCTVIDHWRQQNMVRTSLTHSAILQCASFLFLPHFWHLLWSIIVEMYGKMESTSICEKAHTVVIPSSHNVLLKKLSYNVANVWCVNLGRKRRNICFHMPRCIPKRLIYTTDRPHLKFAFVLIVVFYIMLLFITEVNPLTP